MATYYFSSIAGDDSRTLIQAQSPATPLKTIGLLNILFQAGRIYPGDNILFKQGETFLGTVLVTKSGTASAPIVFGSWGTKGTWAIIGNISMPKRPYIAFSGGIMLLNQ